MLLLTIVCLLSGDIVRTATLPLVIVGSLGGTAQHVSLAFSIVPLTEIPATFLVWRIAKQFGYLTAICLGIACGLVYFVAMSISEDLWLICALQALYALLPATCIGIGIAYAQDMLPHYSSYASSIVLSAQSAAVVLGSLLLAIAAVLGAPQQAFMLPALFCGAALLANLVFRGFRRLTSAEGQLAIDRERQA